VSASAGFLFGVLAAALAAIPAALRTESALVVWAALVGSTAALLGPLLAGLRLLRPMRVGLLAILLGIGLAAWPTALLLSLLKSSTHHRPLGAVTFAFAAGVVLLATCAAALRLLTWFPPGGASRTTRPASVGLLVCALGGPLLLLLRLGASAQARAPLFDACLALGLAAALLLVPWPTRFARWAERGGPAVWGVVVLLGLLAARAAGDTAFQASPVLLGAFAWLLR
jgi:hypothetical protein